MVRCLPDGVMPILIIENKLSVEDIMKVINIYGLNVFKCGIQMQFRTNIEYINKIIEMGFERVIVAVGLMQKDVKEYLEFVDKALRTSKDLILLDMSRHQPHVIVNEKVIDKYDVSFETKYNCLNRIVSCLKKLETSVLLADDIMPDKMILCQLMLLSQGVNIIGLDMPKTGFKYRQIVKLISLNEALINGSIDNRQLKDLAKKILNINKYKTVMLNELSINMMENGYDTIYINRIKELADLLYAEWSDYVTVSVSKIKRKRFDSPEAVTESIEKMEDEIVSITKGYIDFLEKDEGTDRENKKISNEIIFVEEGKIIFSITDGKTHNFWFEDKAPKYPLLKNCNDDKIFAKARILFNQESEENLYQAGIYVKSAEDKVYYMAIDNDRNCILDTIGENNRKEEFDNTNEYLIKMNLEADCLKVQFISDASTKELKMMIERLAPVEVGLMVKTWGNGGFLEVDFKESQAIISNK